MIRAVFFDLDGTLTDSEPIHFEAFNAALAESGLQIARADYFSKLIGFNDRDVFSYVLEERGIAPDSARIAELIAHKHQVVERLIATRELLYPGAAGFVRKCAERFPLMLVTGALRAEAEQILRRAQLRELFLDIIAAEDAEFGKPAPDGFNAALGRIGFILRQRDPVLPEQVMVVEDTPAGIDAAHRAGMKVLAVCNTAGADALNEADLVRSSLAETELDDVLRHFART